MVKINWLKHFTKKRKEIPKRPFYEEQMRSLGLLILSGPGNPAIDIGTALRYANEYKIKLSGGLTYSDVRAEFQRKNWEYPIRENVKSGIFGNFFDDKPHDEISSIYAFGATVQEAVCRCIVFSRYAGVM